jgi:hypothetical protein
MQDQEQPINQGIECSVCGRPGGPALDCPMCFGNPNNVQKRHYTLSEERMGMNREAQKARYGLDGAVGPKRAKVPGSQ